LRVLIRREVRAMGGLGIFQEPWYRQMAANWEFKYVAHEVRVGDETDIVA
jgi:hypothetical protein